MPKKTKKSKEPAVGLNVVNVLVIALLLSLFGNAYQYAQANHLLRFAEDAVNSNPLLTKVAPERPVPGKTWAIHGKSLGSKMGQVMFRSNNVALPAKVVYWGDNQIHVEVPENLVIDQAYTVEVSSVEVRPNGESLTFPIMWEDGNEFVVDSDHYLYTVQTGDSLFKIAQEELGDEGRYVDIISLNRAEYPALNQYSPLSIGMELKIPNE